MCARRMDWPWVSLKVYASPLRPRVWWKHPRTVSPHLPEERVQGGTRVGSQLCPRSVYARDSLSQERRSRDLRPTPPRVLVAPPHSSRHVPQRRPISARCAQARNSNCGTVGLRSALVRLQPPLPADNGAPHRGARAVPGHKAGE